MNSLGVCEAREGRALLSQIGREGGREGGKEGEREV